MGDISETGDIVDVPVVIVGGGSCGLNISIFLSDNGIEHVLLERHPGTSIIPKAHVINQRSMEIFRQHGIVDDILREGTPPRQMSQVVWQTSLGGDGPLDRKILGSIDTWGCKAGTERHTTYLRDASNLPSNLPLLRSEPIFRKIAEQRNLGRILFSHSVEDFTDEGDFVMVSVRSKDGQELKYRAKYLVAADGGKTIGPKLGIVMDGPTNLRKVVSTHFKADLSQYYDDRTGITHFANPELGMGLRSGSLLPIGPSWGRHSEEWQMHFAIKVDEPTFPQEAAITRIRELLKLPDLQLDVLSLSNWVLERVLARTYRIGRVFIGGDAAHRHPPTTGLGLNTAVQDAQNLAWKLAYVLKGKSSPKILDTYEQERLPTGKRVCDWALFTSKCHSIIGAAIGMTDDVEANKVHLATMLDPQSEIGRASHAQLQYTIDGQAVEFKAHEMDLGFYYPQGAFIPDGTKPPPSDPRHQRYTPTTRPGHRLPHVWVERDGKQYSTLDLVGHKGAFLLITDNSGTVWIDAAKKAAEARGIVVEVAKIVKPGRGAPEHSYIDTELHWMEVKGFDQGGAVLVRPDNIVAWRSLGPGKADDVAAAFSNLLGS